VCFSKFPTIIQSQNDYCETLSPVHTCYTFRYDSTVIGDIATLLSQNIINAMYCNCHKDRIKVIKHELSIHN